MADSKRFDYERSDVGIRLVGWLAGGLAIFIVVTPLMLPWMFPLSRTTTTPAGRPALSASAPPLEVDPRDALRRSREDDAHFAQSYGWSDRQRGAVRIPVDRAIDILLRKGLAGWPSQ
ncbi:MULTISPECIES: hypothetical protein [Bradyrhizobium]|uniref:Uncharacterized protein n=1 Tax=Bradyrhizobium elkanii TaxID=29448 RepID=A0A4U6S828_BRAEL|nr:MULTISPECIES: hypothetical protein [Bradyrhizobium]MTV18970.1 hypothetical protein [Bradyrhizobium sp. BR2003]TKV83338.1 hypothetical protein FDV58_03665 [Bradyrhizobium elkanii]